MDVTREPDELDVVEPAGAAEGGEAPDEVATDAGGGVDEAGDEAGALRELVLKAHPDVVPEMVSGETLEELLGSVPAARAAYQRIAGALGHPDPVPAGAPARSAPIDITAMPPILKIREGLK